MTWRAFLLGLSLAALLNWSDVRNGMRGYGKLSHSNFPAACVFTLVVLTLGLNVLIKMVKKNAALRQAELMLIWCMVLIAATVPSTGMKRFWLPMLAAPPYLAQRSETVWRETALQAVPDALVLSKDPKSVAARQFYEAGPPEARVPWRHWLTPIIQWGLFWAALYGAVLFMCAILRKQWVDKERLQFPLARVPLEFSQGSADASWLPSIFRNRAFLTGLLGMLGFRLLRGLPMLFGASSPWEISIPLQDIFQGTALEQLGLPNFTLIWSYVGFAYLVPVDVSMSVWFFYLFTRTEVLAASWLASPLAAGGKWSPLIVWQQAGAYLAFTAGAVFMCRRHLHDVLRKAFGRSRDVDDSGEPIPLGVAFWGFVACSLVAVGWLVGYKMLPIAAIMWFAVLVSVQLVHARIIAQSGMPEAWLAWDPADMFYGLGAGNIFGASGAVIAHMQRRMLYNIPHGPAMMHCMRIGDVFKERRRLLAPIIFLVLVVSVVVSSLTFLNEAYARGVLNFNIDWEAIGNPRAAFDLAHQKMVGAGESGGFNWFSFVLGAVTTSVVMTMRARFYWWPLHSIGLMANCGWVPDRIWFPFLLGWLIKLGVSKYAGGRSLRWGRYFFIGLIMAEAVATGLSTVLRAATSGGTPLF